MVVSTVSQASNLLNLSSVTGLTTNTRYNVRVKIDMGTYHGDYGTGCLIGIMVVQLRSVDCGRTNFNLVSSVIVSDWVSGATQYTFEFKNLSNIVVATISQASNVLNLSSVTGLTANTNYNVRVKIDMGTYHGDYGTSCLIGFGPSLRMTEEQYKGNNSSVGEVDFFDLISYPNPFTGTATIKINCSSCEDATLRLFDISGQVVMQRILKANESLEIGEGLSAGIYIAEAIQKNGNRSRIKIVKTNN